MKVQNYLICLGNAKGADCAWWDLVCATQRLFEQCLPKGHDVNVAMVDKPPALTRRDVLVYVVPSSMDSVVAHRFKCSTDGNGATGWTSAETASEIYLSGIRDSSALARLIFHEILHNKLHYSDAKLHPLGGLAGNPIGDHLTTRNKQLMQTAFQKAQTQWTGGFASTNDPLRELGL
jgi:hypothetical protein